jgi:putative membrane protein
MRAAAARADTGVPERAPAWALLCAAVAAQIAYPLCHGTTRAHLTIAIVLLMAAAALADAVVELGARIGATVLALCAGAGLAAELIGTATGFPFGDYGYGTGLGPRIGDVPVAVALAWVMGAWPALSAARRLSPAADGMSLWRQVGLTALGLWSWDLFLDPQMVADGRWRWAHPDPHLPGVPSVPLTNYAGWALVAAAIAAIMCLVSYRYVGRAGRAAGPTPGEAQFLWAWIGSVVAHAAFLGLPGSAAWGGAAMAAIGLPLIAILIRAGRTEPAPAPAGRAAVRG